MLDKAAAVQQCSSAAVVNTPADADFYQKAAQ